MTEGHNTPKAIYLKHQAVAILDKEQADALHKIKKRHRKDAELAGVPLDVMDWTIKTLATPVGEIAKFFRQRLESLSYNGVNIAAKIDAVLGDHTEDQTFAGQLAGMQGKACSPPANLTPHEQQTWIAGWHEGEKARNAAKAAAAEEAAAAGGGETKLADETTLAAAELGGGDYDSGEEGDKGAGDGFTASDEEISGQASRPSVQAAEELAPETPPHQPAKRKPRAKAPAEVH